MFMLNNKNKIMLYSLLQNYCWLYIIHGTYTIIEIYNCQSSQTKQFKNVLWLKYN